VRFNNGPADGQTHPHPLGFGRKKRVEYLISFLGRDTFTGVRNRYRYAAVFG
jgi:hypothetical protein